jgi:hypothetical protein
MAVLIFKLRYVPEDEAQDVRDLLNENDIDYYETSAGILGFSMPGLWLRNDDQREKARQLIDEYQQQRQTRVREEYQSSKRTFMHMFREDPYRYTGYILIILLICYFMVFLFIRL